MVVVQNALDAVQHLLDEPGLDHDEDDVATHHGHVVLGGDIGAAVGEALHGMSGGVAHTDVLVLHVTAFQQSLHDGATHGTGSYD